MFYDSKQNIITGKIYIFIHLFNIHQNHYWQKCWKWICFSSVQYGHKNKHQVWSDWVITINDRWSINILKKKSHSISSASLTWSSCLYKTAKQRLKAQLCSLNAGIVWAEQEERWGGWKKIKEEPTVPTSISNTVAHAAIFKPDAGLRKPQRRRDGKGREGQLVGEERLFGRNVVWVKQHEEMVAQELSGQIRGWSLWVCVCMCVCSNCFFPPTFHWYY